MEKIEIKKGETILEFGEKNDHFFVVLEGYVDIFTALTKLPAKIILIDTISFGEYIGQVSFLDRQPSPIKAVAKTTCTLHIYMKADLENNVTNKEIFKGLLLSICRKYRAQIKV